MREHSRTPATPGGRLNNVVSGSMSDKIYSGLLIPLRCTMFRKKEDIKLMAVTQSNLKRFSQFFHRQVRQ